MEIGKQLGIIIGLAGSPQPIDSMPQAERDGYHIAQYLASSESDSLGNKSLDFILKNPEGDSRRVVTMSLIPFSNMKDSLESYWTQDCPSESGAEKERCESVERDLRKLRDNQESGTIDYVLVLKYKETNGNGHGIFYDVGTLDSLAKHNFKFGESDGASEVGGDGRHFGTRWGLFSSMNNFRDDAYREAVKNISNRAKYKNTRKTQYRK